MLNEKFENGIITAEFDHGKVNTLTMETLQQLDSIVKKANKDETVKGIILTGAGNAFSAGFDLSIFTGFKDIKEAVSFFEKEEEVLLNLFMCSKPVVSAINGHAIAGGLILAMASDYRIGKNHPKIKLSMSEIKIGISLTITMTEVVKFGFDSNRVFRDIMYFGDIFSIEKGHRMRIIDEITEEDKLISRAEEVIQNWSGNPGNAFSQLKERLRRPVYNTIKEGMADGEWKEGLKVFFNPEARKAMEFVHAMMNKD